MNRTDWSDYRRYHPEAIELIDEDGTAILVFAMQRCADGSYDVLGLLECCDSFPNGGSLTFAEQVPALDAADAVEIVRQQIMADPDAPRFVQRS